MPMVIALLNSYAGFRQPTVSCSNNVLIISGSWWAPRE